MRIEGISSYAQLRGEGCSRKDIEDALSTGQLRRVARGWYAHPDADPAIVRALSANGRLGCLSGCRHHGLWTPSLVAPHVVYGAGIPTRPVRGITAHVSDYPQPRSAVWPLLHCLQHVVQRHDAETATIVLDSAKHLHLIDDADLPAILGHPSRSRNRLVQSLDAAESGSETRVRLFLRARRIPVVPQVEIPRVGTVDLVVGDKLIIETDGATIHRTVEQHEADRARDLAARDQGYDTIRLSYTQVWRCWAATQQSLLRALHQRRHISRRPRRSGARGLSQPVAVPVPRRAALPCTDLA